MRKTTSAVTLATLCAGLLVGCGSGDADDQTEDQAWRPDSSVPTEPGADGFTPPDAVLSLGDTASVPLLDEGMMDDPDVTGSLEVTVTDAPVSGAPDELPTDALLMDEMEGTPHYVTFTVKNVGESDVGGAMIRLQAIDAGGEDLDTWASSSFARCPGGLPPTFAPGQTATTCSVVFVEDDELAAVGYAEAADYEDDAVLWDLT